jgi:membrane protein DedA with SNARE-associated domain
MDDLLAIVLEYGYVLLFAFVSAEQIGLPVPAVPVLLGVGALAGRGRMSIALALGIALMASLPPDIVWYELGRRRGGRVLGFLCRISLEPDACVRRTETLFIRRGPAALLIAKFVPGFSTVAPALAGVAGIDRQRFLVLDSMGALLWAGAWLVLGYALRGMLDSVVAVVARAGHDMLVVAVTALAAWVGMKFLRRWWFLRWHRMARITPDELKRRLDAGDATVVVIDTRSAIDVKATPFVIRGALCIPAEEIEQRHREVPRDCDVVLYCT